MQRYIVRRLVIALPVLLGITVINFLIINLAPGDPLTALVTTVKAPLPPAAPRVQPPVAPHPPPPPAPPQTPAIPPPLLANHWWC